MPPLEKRVGVCATCNGRIYRYPHPTAGEPDRWAHRDTSDWIDNPHEAAPQPEEGTE
jgi:hypothetical protein